ncbi:MAG: hypothetical protein ACRYGC_04820 [Janthinobacterium lividum]
MSPVTITGANHAILTVSMDGTTNLQLAQQFATLVNNAAAANTLAASLLSDVAAVLPAPAAGFLGEAEIDASSLNIAWPAGYNAILDVAAGPTTISAALAVTPISVLSASGGTTFFAGAAQTMFIAGGGNNVFNGFVSPAGITSLPGAGSSTLNMVATGGGNDTITTGTGNFDVDPGTGRNVVTLGTGISYVNSLGQDLITGGDAHTTAGVPNIGTIYLSGTGATVQGGTGTLAILASNGITSPGGGLDVVTLGSGGGSITGVSNSTFNLAGTASVTGGGNDTINMGSASATVLGAAGADLFRIGSASSSLTGGAGAANLYEFQATATGGATDVIGDFKTADKLSISGYTANGAAVLANATVSGGSTTITLSDQTKIVLTNFASLTGGNFS